MIEARRAQRNFGDGFITAEIRDPQEPWMAHVDAMLADEAMVSSVHRTLVRRHPQSRRRGRLGFPAEEVLRLLVLKHIRNWSYAVLEREVRANLVYRDFTRVGAAKMPDAKTMGRWGVAMGADRDPPDRRSRPRPAWPCTLLSKRWSRKRARRKLSMIRRGRRCVHCRLQWEHATSSSLTAP